MKSSVMPMDRAFRGVVNPPPTILIVSKKYQPVCSLNCNRTYYINKYFSLFFVSV